MNILLVAYNKKRVIGSRGQMPWHLPEDLALFKARTTGHAIVMGRKTWDSIRIQTRKIALPGRANYIITSSAPRFRLQYEMLRKPEVGPFFVENLEGVLNWTDMHHETTFIVGGEQIYRQALELGVVDRIIASEVDGDQEGDAMFPELGPEWHPMVMDVREGFKVIEFHKKVEA